MKHLVSIGLLLAATSAWGQVPGERTDAPALCAPFVGYATNLLSFFERAEQTGRAESSYAAARRVADATLKCADAETRLLSRAYADAHLATLQRQFDVGTATTFEVGAARVAVQKASYCEAAFEWVTSSTQQFQVRFDVGLIGPQGLAPILAELEALVPVCGIPRI